MTSPMDGPAGASSRWKFTAAGVLALVVVSWLVLSLYTSPEVRECERRYAAARTAADTSTVDMMVPGRGVEARSCVSMRNSARWR